MQKIVELGEIKFFFVFDGNETFAAPLRCLKTRAAREKNIFALAFCGPQRMPKMLASDALRLRLVLYSVETETAKNHIRVNSRFLSRLRFTLFGPFADPGRCVRRSL